MIRFLILTVFIILTLATYSNANGNKICTKEEAIKAENSVSLLKNWKDIYDSFKKFQHCDDGAIAEGYSDTIVRMLALHWDQIGEFDKLTTSDKKFLTFILRHINETADEVKIKKIITNSTKHCPKSTATLCSAIEKKAKKVCRE